MTRLDVTKTYKLFIGGAFPRSESGRTIEVRDTKQRVIAHICRASRKDLRNAVEAAHAAQRGWSARTAYNRGQIMYRIAEMLEGKRDEFIAAIRATTGDDLRQVRKQVDASIDRLVCFAGWTDKYQQVLGCQNPVAAPYYNFTVPEPSGVVGVVAPEQPPLLGLLSLIAPPLCAGDTIVAITSGPHQLAAAILGEVLATSDVPAGVVNILTGKRDELIEHVANHRQVAAISAAGVTSAQARSLRLGSADNLKRVHVASAGRRADDESWYDNAAWQSPWTIEPFVEMKTIWHPSAM